MLYWDSVPTASRHGVILGYTVTYRASFEASGKELVLNNAVTSSVELSGLHNFTFYTISIRAKNSKGNGAASGQIIVQTGEDGKMFHHFCKKPS